MMYSFLTAIVLALNVAVTVLLLRSSVPTPKQRLVHLGIVWLVPVFGAILIALFYRSIESKDAPHATSTRNEQDYPGVNLYPPHGPSDN